MEGVRHHAASAEVEGCEPEWRDAEIQGGESIGGQAQLVRLRHCHTRNARRMEEPAPTSARRRSGIRCERGSGSQKVSPRLLTRDHSIEMQLHFAVDYSADAFDEAVRFIVLLATADDFVARDARRDHERRLVNDLTAGV